MLSARDMCRIPTGEEPCIETYIDLPLDIFEQRDTKGVYARARRGEMKGYAESTVPTNPPTVYPRPFAGRRIMRTTASCSIYPKDDFFGSRGLIRPQFGSPSVL